MQFEERHGNQTEDNIPITPETTVRRDSSTHGHPCVVIQYVRNQTAKAKEKRIQFDFGSEADKFKRAVENLSDKGQALWNAFERLQESTVGLAILTPSSLAVAVEEYRKAPADGGATGEALNKIENADLVTRMLDLTSTHHDDDDMSNVKQMRSSAASQMAIVTSSAKKKLDDGLITQEEYLEIITLHHDSHVAGTSEPNPEAEGCSYREFFAYFVFGLHDVPTDKDTVLKVWIDNAEKSFQSDESPGRQRLRSGSSSEEGISKASFLEGEVTLRSDQNVRCAVGAVHETGNLYTTNYRVIFRGYHNQGIGSHQSGRFGVANGVRVIGVLHVPLASILQIDYSKSQDPLTMLLHAKDGRKVKLTWITKDRRRSWQQAPQMAYQMISETAPSETNRPFAYYYKPDIQPAQLPTAFDEYTRQGFFDMHTTVASQRHPVWRLKDQSEDNFAFSPTYPSFLLVPNHITDASLAKAAEYRSKKRLPVAVFRHPTNGAVLCRCSQPMVGLKKNVNAEDVRLLEAYRLRGFPSDSAANDLKFVILDCRGSVAATGNQAMGKGTEDVTNYTNTTLVFGGIGNIHTMRSSLKTLQQVVLPSEDNGGDFIAKLQESGWLNHVRLVLDLAVTAAKHMHVEKSGVLVHCSDGWDRTAQIVSMAQLLMDPYFRTIEGFALLIEKEWVSFGHKFSDRCCHGAKEPTEEYSPIFLQWLDCVHQLIDQFPTAFEFTELLLVFIADHIYSGLFGTFFENSDHERLAKKISESTTSIWTYVFMECKRYPSTKFRNPTYDKERVEPLEPYTGLRLRLWERYFCRWDPAMHPREDEIPAALYIPWRDDWGRSKVAHDSDHPSFVVGGVKAPENIQALPPPAPAQHDGTLPTKAAASEAAQVYDDGARARRKEGSSTKSM